MGESRLAAAAVILTVLAGAGVSVAGDWPTFRKDAGRSGITDEQLRFPLSQSWVFTERFKPEPAFGPGYPHGTNWEGGVEKRRIDFDRADSAVVAGGRVYFGSVGDGKVYCLDAQSGQVVWTFATGGPVRLAPTVNDGKIYFGSDDGYVYCLKAANGKVVWTLRAAPGDHRVIGNGSLVSLWPVRTNVTVDSGVAYFGAGIFAGEGVFIYAADAATGKVLWRNAAGGEMRMGQICPMGYLLVTRERLVVPMARLSPAVYDRKTGQQLLRLSIYYGGGTFATLYRGLLFTGWETDFCFDVAKDLPTHGGTSASVANFLGGQLVATGQAVYSCGLPKAAGVSKAVIAYTWVPPESVPTPEEQKRGEAKPVEKPKELWKSPVDQPESIIVSGQNVIVGRAGEVLALSAADGKTVWSGKVEGTALSLAVADGRLYVSTSEGRQYCFGPAGAKAAGQVAQATQADVAVSPAMKAAAEDILKRAPHAKKGFALVCGVETGELAVELARRTEMKVYALTPDATKAAAARTLADTAGLLGGRVVVLQMPLEKIPFTKYFADLVVSETAAVSGTLVGSAAEVCRMTKPIRGTVVYGNVPADAWKAWAAGTPLAEATVTDSFAAWTRPPLRGAVDWTHQYGGPGNTGASNDDLVRTPLRVQWFGSPGAERFVDRHYWGAAPLAMNGRMFVCSYDDVRAYDAYNGTQLWCYPLANATRAHVADVPSNVAVCAEGYFVAVDSTCYRLDPATGKKLAEYTVPAPADNSKRLWGYVGVLDGVLVGSRTLGYMEMDKWRKSRGNDVAKWLFSDQLFGIDIATGKVLWTYKVDWFRHNIVTMGGGRVFLSHHGQTTEEAIAAAKAETAAAVKAWPQLERKAVEKSLTNPELMLLRALDVKTGKIDWEQLVDWTLVGGGRGTLVYTNGRLLQMSDVGGCKAFTGYSLQGNYGRAVTLRNAEDGKLIWTKSLNYRSRAIVTGETIIAEPWAYDLKTGQQKMVEHPTTGQSVPWAFVRSEKHCGPFNASKHMLFFRNGGFGYLDINRNEGVDRFESNRPNCWNSFVSSQGLALWPTSDSGCRCAFAISCTVALVHDDTGEHRVFGDFTTGGSLLPVKHMAVNLGAPGDRRDARNRLWLAFPRHKYTGGLELPLKAEFYEGGAFTRRNSSFTPMAGTDRPWVLLSEATGLKRLEMPLRTETDGPETYTVTLSFAAPPGDTPGKRVFDITVQGAPVKTDIDIVKAAGATDTALEVTLKNIRVKDTLIIELLKKTDAPPVLSGIDIVAE